MILVLERETGATLITELFTNNPQRGVQRFALMEDHNNVIELHQIPTVIWDDEGLQERTQISVYHTANTSIISMGSQESMTTWRTPLMMFPRSLMDSPAKKNQAISTMSSLINEDTVGIFESTWALENHHPLYNAFPNAVGTPWTESRTAYINIGLIKQAISTHRPSSPILAGTPCLGAYVSSDSSSPDEKTKPSPFPNQVPVL